MDDTIGDELDIAAEVAAAVEAHGALGLTDELIDTLQGLGGTYVDSSDGDVTLAAFYLEHGDHQLVLLYSAIDGERGFTLTRYKLEDSRSWDFSNVQPLQSHEVGG